MKKQVLYIAILVTLFTACKTEQREVAIIADDISEEVFYLEDEIKPFTGICNIINPKNGSITQKLSFKKGILWGEATAYYPCGRVRRKGTFHNGMLHGTWTFFNEEGNKTLEVNYQNDKLEGVYTKWFSNGKVQEQGIYRQNSRTGEWETYLETGELESETDYATS